MARLLTSLRPSSYPGLRIPGYQALLRLSKVLPPTPLRRKATTVELPYKKLSDTSEARIQQPGTGKVYDKKPFKVSLIKGKKYAWCTCGWSKWQPFCDQSHTYPHYKIKLKPVVFVSPETGDYWLCNCKQTSQRPFCDGTHRNEEIQTKVRS